MQRLLLVEDDDRLREMLAEYFLESGFQVDGEPRGDHAVHRILTTVPDLVILDMMLPGRSGFLALEKIKGNPDSPLVIMVTANEGLRHKEYAENMGVDAYLQKPVPLEALIETAAELLREKSD